MSTKVTANRANLSYSTNNSVYSKEDTEKAIAEYATAYGLEIKRDSKGNFYIPVTPLKLT